VSTSTDAAILLVIENLTKMYITVGPQGLIFIWEQNLCWKLQPTYFAAIHQSLKLIV